MNFLIINPLVTEIVLFLICWYSLWIPIVYSRHFLKKDYLSDPTLFSILFGISTVGFFYIGQRWFSVGAVSYRDVIIFSIFLLSFILWFYNSSSKAFPVDNGQEHVPEHAQWSIFDERYIAPKFMEVLFQELFVSGLITILINYDISLMSIILGFSVIFSIMHMPLFLFHSWQWSTFYTVSAFLSAIVFPLSVFLFRYSFFVNISIHWIYFLIAGVVYLHYRNVGHYHGALH
jgi:hypothetical protein